MVRADFQSMPMGHLYIAFITVVNTVTTFRCLQIDIRHLGLFTNSLPEHITLIVTEVDTMNMVTCVLTAQIGILMDCGGLGSDTSFDHTRNPRLFPIFLTGASICILNNNKKKA